MEPIVEVIEQALKDRGLTAAEVSRLARGNPSVIKNMQNPRGKEPKLNYYALRDIAEVLGLELYFGPPRHDPRERLVDPVVAGLELIPRLDVEASAGNGAAVMGEAALEPVAFRRDWLVSQGLMPADLVLIAARGTSMEPIISDGDLVMVDTSRRTIPILGKGRRARRALYWVIRWEGEVMVKDVERTDDTTFVLTSENSYAYRPKVVLADPATDFDVIGRVAWWGHTVPL